MSISTSYNMFHEKGLGSLIFPFLEPADRKNLSQVDKLWHQAKLQFDTNYYTTLQNKIKLLEDHSQKEKLYLYIKDSNEQPQKGGQRQEVLLRILGRGGRKKAIQLEEGRALMLPNMDLDSDLASVSKTAQTWPRAVHEEVKMSQFLTTIGLLSPLSKRVSTSLSLSTPQQMIPAYLSETFENLGKTKNWFIIDRKDGGKRISSTWIKGEHFLFRQDTDRLNETNWDSVLDHMLDDLVKIFAYALPWSGREDSFNLAITKEASGLETNSVSDYQIRYFGFDFSSPHSCLSEIRESPILKLPDELSIKYCLNFVFDKVFFYEFGEEYNFDERLDSLQERLVEKHTKQVLSRYEIFLTKFRQGEECSSQSQSRNRSTSRGCH